MACFLCSSLTFQPIGLAAILCALLKHLNWRCSFYRFPKSFLKSVLCMCLPEHLKSCSCSSAKLCPFNWLGEWHRVYGARRGELRKYRDNHDKWQSHVNGLSDRRNARMRGIPLNISRGKVVMLLLFNVLGRVEWKKNEWWWMDIGHNMGSTV